MRKWWIQGLSLLIQEVVWYLKIVISQWYWVPKTFIWFFIIQQLSIRCGLNTSVSSNTKSQQDFYNELRGSRKERGLFASKSLFFPTRWILYSSLIVRLIITSCGRGKTRTRKDKFVDMQYLLLPLLIEAFVWYQKRRRRRRNDDDEMMKMMISQWYLVRKKVIWFFLVYTKIGIYKKWIIYKTLKARIPGA